MSYTENYYMKLAYRKKFLLLKATTKKRDWKKFKAQHIDREIVHFHSDIFCKIEKF